MSAKTKDPLHARQGEDQYTVESERLCRWIGLLHPAERIGDAARRFMYGG